MSITFYVIILYNIIIIIIIYYISYSKQILLQSDIIFSLAIRPYRTLSLVGPLTGCQCPHTADDYNSLLVNQH